MADPHVITPRWLGPPRVRFDIRNLRKANLDMALYLGTPFVWRHKLNNDDLDDGYSLSLPGTTYSIPVQHCAACFNSYRGQVRDDCPICFGSSFTSVETVEDEWIDDDGEIVDDDLGEDNLAPVWRGYGPSVIIWIIEPDAAVDVFKLSSEGAIVQTQNAQAFAPWYPDISDNDLLIEVQLADNMYDIESEGARYEPKMVNPLSIRGMGKASRGQEFLVGQTFEMVKLPRGSEKQNVPVL